MIPYVTHIFPVLYNAIGDRVSNFQLLPLFGSCCSHNYVLSNRILTIRIGTKVWAMIDSLPGLTEQNRETSLVSFRSESRDDPNRICTFIILWCS